jgi:hypothetical protein
MVSSLYIYFFHGLCWLASIVEENMFLNLYLHLSQAPFFLGNPIENFEFSHLVQICWIRRFTFFETMPFIG